MHYFVHKSDLYLETDPRIQNVLALFYHRHNLPYLWWKMGGQLPFFVNCYCSFCSKGMFRNSSYDTESILEHFCVKTLLLFFIML